MKHTSKKSPWSQIALVQAIVLAAFGLAFARNSTENEVRLKELVTHQRSYPNVPVTRDTALQVTSLYNDPKLVPDADLAAVLKQVRPEFAPKHLKPNYVEHALRIWGVNAKFNDPKVLSGKQLEDFLLDHGKYIASWSTDIAPLLQEEPDGVAVRWGSAECASVHHDHLLACLSEAGINRNQRVYTPARHVRTFNDVLQLSIRDLQVDERETEWSALAYALWLPPFSHWKNREGREISFDLLAERLIRGQQTIGVCHGTHRVYTLVVLLRLDEQFKILCPCTRDKIRTHLLKVRQELIESQFADGHWPSNWPNGKEALKTDEHEELFRKVIATGHHLEWMALAPQEFHPPREQIEKAVRWVVKTTTEQPTEKILERYTFYSHVGGALALWRQTHPADFWTKWESTKSESQARADH